MLLCFLLTSDSLWSIYHQHSLRLSARLLLQKFLPIMHPDTHMLLCRLWNGVTSRASFTGDHFLDSCEDLSSFLHLQNGTDVIQNLHKTTKYN